MNRAAKIATGASIAVIAVLVALATPAVASVLGEMSAWAIFQPQADAQPQADPQPVTDTGETPPGIAPDGPLARDGRVHYALGGVIVGVLPGECIPALIVNDKLHGTLIDHGAREYANGTMVYNDAGEIKGYEVAEGDTLFAIGERFCMSTAEIFYANKPADLPADTGYTIQPGQVLVLDPGA